MKNIFYLIKVKELREWVKSDPDVLAIRELNLFPNRLSNNPDDTSPTDEELIEAANAMNIQSTSHGITQFSFPSAIPIKISQINQDTYFDIVLQV